MNGARLECWRARCRVRLQNARWLRQCQSRETTSSMAAALPFRSASGHGFCSVIRPRLSKSPPLSVGFFDRTVLARIPDRPSQARHAGSRWSPPMASSVLPSSLTSLRALRSHVVCWCLPGDGAVIERATSVEPMVLRAPLVSRFFCPHITHMESDGMPPLQSTVRPFHGATRDIQQFPARKPH